MIYSAWDHAERRYDYYRTPEKSARTQAPKPSHLRSQSLGMTPEQAAWPLPASARLVGHGKYPKGMIASSQSAGMGLGSFLSLDLTFSNLMLLGLVGFLLLRR
jgi:hypothetical protein